MTTLPLAVVRARLSAELDSVSRTHERVVITRNGRPEAVILSLDDLAAIEETIEVLSTPRLPVALDVAAAEIDSGQWVGPMSSHAVTCPGVTEQGDGYELRMAGSADRASAWECQPHLAPL